MTFKFIANPQRMIGPSSGTSGVTSSIVEDQSRSSNCKRKVFEGFEIEDFCEDPYPNGRKRYLQDTEPPEVEFVAANQVIPDGEYLTVGDQETNDEFHVARLEVLVVGGTNCTWTTVADLEQHGTELDPISASSLSSAFSTNRRRDRNRSLDPTIDDRSENCTFQETNNDFWEPVGSIVTIPTSDPLNDKSGIVCVNNVQEQQQQQMQQQQYEDQENGNLSWLLDFKLDSLIEAADDRATPGIKRDNNYGNKNKFNGRMHGIATNGNDCKRNYNSNGYENSSSLHQDGNQSSSYQTNDSRNFAARCNGPKKPPFTYTELIEHALQERGELTVSAIYQWISEHFPYYKSNDDRWKNSVRHNLSINPHFRKGSKAPHGAGHLWAIANPSDCRPRQFSTNIANSISRSKNLSDSNNFRINGSASSQVTPIDEIEAATASITQPSSEEETELVNSVTLEHCAEQILSGIKKNVEVQYLVPMMVSNNSTQDTCQANHQSVQSELHSPVKESDFLNPVSKEVVAEECGLISEGYLVTDLNPTTLGLNMVEPEIITPENLFGEDLSFQFYELTSPSQLQSA